jgi:type IV pilus assembly protein PilO
MKLNDFKNIDIKTAGNLPMTVKLVLVVMVFSLVLFGGYLLIWAPSLETLDIDKNKEAELRTKLTEKRRLAFNLNAYKQQMRDLDQTFGALLKQLPDKSQMDGLLTDINQAGLAQGLVFDSFKPADEIISDFYAEKPIAIKVVGNYHQLGHFTEEISKLSRIVTLNDLVINPVPKESKDNKESKENLLSMEVVAKTYRYLDANEVAAKKQALKGEKK